MLGPYNNGPYNNGPYNNGPVCFSRPFDILPCIPVFGGKE
jgi:hypothetical protein